MDYTTIENLYTQFSKRARYDKINITAKMLTAMFGSDPALRESAENHFRKGGTMFLSQQGRSYTLAWVRGAYHNAYHRSDGPALELLTPRGFVRKWYYKGQIHRTDGPAVESTKETQWYFLGKLHREDGPALIGKDKEAWLLHGTYHRDGGPAYKDKEQELWYKHGKPHREGGPAIIKPNQESWMQDGAPFREHDLPTSVEHGVEYWHNAFGEFHRENGPAIVHPSGKQEWFIEGERHRDDGPAYVTDKTEKWYLGGKKTTQEKVDSIVQEKFIYQPPISDSVTSVSFVG